MYFCRLQDYEVFLESLQWCIFHILHVVWFYPLASISWDFMCKYYWASVIWFFNYFMLISARDSILNPVIFLALGNSVLPKSHSRLSHSSSRIPLHHMYLFIVFLMRKSTGILCQVVLSYHNHTMTNLNRSIMCTFVVCVTYQCYNAIMFCILFSSQRVILYN